MGERFLKDYWNDKSDEVYISGAYALYRFLWKNLARKGWVDKYGYSLKRRYYDEGKLACSFPLEKLKEHLGVGSKNIKRWTKILLEAGWIEKERKTKLGQNVFILGTHEGKDIGYKENLFKDNWIKKEEPTNMTEEIKKYYDNILMMPVKPL